MTIKRLLILFFVLFVACQPLKRDSTDDTDSGDEETDGNSDGNSNTEIPLIEGDGLNDATEVNGTFTTVGGTPIAGATVFIPGVDVSGTYSGLTRTYDQGLVASDGTICEDVPEEYEALVIGCTAADGTFVLNTAGLSLNPTQIIFQKGSLIIIMELTCTGNICTVSPVLGSSGDVSGYTVWPRVAVVTGLLDRMENVLGKIADDDLTDTTSGQYGRVDSEGNFIYGSEYNTNLTIIDGIDGTEPEINGDKLTYRKWGKYLDGTYNLVSNGAPVFDVIFIDCETTYEDDISGNESVLRDYVTAGGRLYVTDRSYDYIEQAFPYLIIFANDPDDEHTTGVLSDAEYSGGGDAFNAEILDVGLKTWLASATVNAKTSNILVPGNPNNDCLYEGTYHESATALTSGLLVPIGDLLGNWAHVEDVGDDVKVWVTSGAYSLDDQQDRPLTVSADVGVKGGKVIYSSYHTAFSCTTQNFWPQERILQYMIFESF